MADRRTTTRAKKARDKVVKMIAEITNWAGQKPTIIRVNIGDYLAMKECNFIRENDLFSGTDVTVRPG